MEKNVLLKNRFVIFIVLLSVALCSLGITWGKVEEWHPDQMAFRNLFNQNALPFNPAWFLRPPFHTYVNYFLSVLPFDLLSKLFSIPFSLILSYRLVWSRLLTVFMFIGSGLCMYYIIKKASNSKIALLTFAIFLTSAGLITNAHFLTSDIPIMFWLTLAVYTAFQAYRTKRMRGLLLAGFITGIASATKYNGIVGVFAICTAFAALCNYSLKNMIKYAGWLIIAFCTTVVGFIVGNPYSVLSHKLFVRDFLYLINTDKLYFLPNRINPTLFIYGLIEAVGWPTLIVIAVGLILVCKGLWKKQIYHDRKFAYLVSLSIIIPNLVFVAGYPTVPMRYMIPTIPFFLILGSCAISQYERRPWFVYVIIAIVVYNTLCSIYVGVRFLSDPRTVAQLWVQQHVTKGSKIENYYYSPSWDLLPGVGYDVTKAPYLSGRNRRFQKLLSSTPLLVQRLQEVDQEGVETETWYSLAGLAERSPDYIAIDSLIYDRFIYNTPTKQYYPEISQYYNAILQEKYPYHIVFDQISLPPYNLLYPNNIDVLDNRMVILQKDH